MLSRILNFNRIERKLQFECLGRLGAKVVELKSNEAIDDLFYALRIQDEENPARECQDTAVYS
jgi:hypothetical protein